MRFDQTVDMTGTAYVFVEVFKHIPDHPFLMNLGKILEQNYRKKGEHPFRPQMLR